MKKDLENIFSLDGKVEVVTGATGLLGRKHVEAIAAYGGTPVILDLLQNRVEELADEINQKYSVNASGFSVDITDELEIEKNCAHLIEKYGKIDALVNNAANNPKVENQGDTNFSRLENFPLEVWHADLAVGLTGSFLCAKHYGSAISNNPDGGVIFSIYLQIWD